MKWIPTIVVLKIIYGNTNTVFYKYLTESAMQRIWAKEWIMAVTMKLVYSPLLVEKDQSSNLLDIKLYLNGKIWTSFPKRNTFAKYWNDFSEIILNSFICFRNQNWA